MRTTVIAAAVVTAALCLTGCSAADRANSNLSTAAENFEVPRRIVGVNTIKGDVLFEVTGFCSYEVEIDTIEVVCATEKGGGQVERTTLGRADNVTFVSTQTGPINADFYKPRVIFRPESVIPNFDLSTSADLEGNGNG